MDPVPRTTTIGQAPPHPGGFILVFSMLMLLGISATGVSMFYSSYTGRVTAQNYRARVQAFFAADAMVTLLAQETLDGRADVYIEKGETGKITGEVWDGISGSQVEDLQSAISANPNGGRKVESDYFGSNWKSSNYGVRWRGFLCPPLTGSYTFLVRSSDASSLYLSTDDKPENLLPKPIAYLAAAAKPWPIAGTGQSDPIALEGGKRYYFEYLHKAGAGGLYGDFGQVGWNGPQWLNDRPITGKYLAPYTDKAATTMNTTKVGNLSVGFRLSRLVPDVYQAHTEAFRVVGQKDTAVRASLDQVLSLKGQSMAPPDTIWMHVLFYDFHSNGSNPEFEAPFAFGVKPGMVKNNQLRYVTENADYFGLTSIPKPVVSSAPHWNCSIEKWFTEFKPGDFTVPAGGSDCTPVAVATDTSFKNILFKDSLPFTRNPALGPNTYWFSRSGMDGEAPFFPLNGKGYGTEYKSNNYSFCMELHTQFQHASGMTFDFTGDDDVWLFLNDSLVMDLGGVHNPSTYHLDLDDLVDLKFNEIYPFDLFYCERHTGGSSIRMSTSMPILSTTGKVVTSWRRDYGVMD